MKNITMLAQKANQKTVPFPYLLGISSSVGAFCLMLGLMNNSGSTALAAFGVGTVGSGGITLVASSHMMQKRANKLESELSKAQANLSRAKRDGESLKRDLEDMERLQNLLTQLRETIAQKDADIAAHVQKTSTVQGNLSREIVANANLTEDKNQVLSKLSQAETENATLTADIAQLEANFETELKADIEKAIEAIRDSLDTEARVNALAEKKEILAVYDELKNLFIGLADNNSLLSSAYREDIGGQEKTINELCTEIGNFAAQKAQLEEQYQGEVHSLKSQLQRDYQEPIYLDAQFSPSLQAANAIIKSLYDDMGIAVEGMGGTVEDNGLVKFGILPSFAMEGEALARQINQRSKNFAQSLKLGQAPKAIYHPEFRAIEIVFRRDAKPVSESLPRFLKDDFSAFVKQLLAPNVPAIRVMGESGSGKSSITRLILGEAHKIKPVQILLHDPQAGTEEDRWEIEATDSDAKSTAKALKNLASDVENKVRLTNRTFHVFDELDGLCKSDKDVKSGLLTVAKKARHIHDLYVLFMGQSPNVGNQGLQWADMGNFAAVYIGESALHGIEKNPVLASVANKLKPQYQEVSEYCEGKNSAQNLEGFEPEAYRFALINIPGKQPYFLLIPPFSEGIKGYSEDDFTASVLDGGAMDSPPQPSTVKPETLAVSLDVLDGCAPIGGNGYPSICPHCQGKEFASKGERWVCKSCKKTGKKTV